MLADYERIFRSVGIPQSNMKRFSLVAEENGRAIGFIAGMTDHLWLYLSDLWVEESKRGAGIGTQLLKEFEEQLISNGIEHIYLWTYGSKNNSFMKEMVFHSLLYLKTTMR